MGIEIAGRDRRMFFPVGHDFIHVDEQGTFAGNPHDDPHLPRIEFLIFRMFVPLFLFTRSK
ncbi:MAG: hypothetical protein PVF55_03190 [Desulfobacterales bacterium]